jgi:hypothetical protein
VKLRIHGNSLRLRLNQAEVAQFSKTGFIEEAIEFGPGARLAFSLESQSGVDTPQALFEDSWIRIQIPTTRAENWVTSDLVGVAAEQPLGAGKHLSIMIEKDFKCMHGPVPEDPDAYPNPLAATEQAVTSPRASAIRLGALSEDLPPAKAK